MENGSSTLQVQGFTPYAQIPRWVIRSGSSLSHAAVRLYGAIMTYADNSTNAAFPSRETLAKDVGVKPRSISAYIKELEEFGALKVERRRNKKTGNFYANHYTLVFDDPGANSCTPPSAENDPITKPTTLTTPTNVFTSNLRSDPTFHAQAELEPTHRKHLVSLIHTIGLHRQAGHDWWSDAVQDLWDMFLADFEAAMGDRYADGYAHVLANTWTISATCANKYQAGAELNKMIATGALV